MTIEISCLCGEVKIELENEPLKQFYCHCDDCQAVHGAAYIGIALYPHDAIKIVQGQPAKWVYKSNPRSRCNTCGTILFAEPPGAPFKGVKANLLPAGIFKPDCHIQCQYALIPLNDELPHYKGFPAMFKGSDEEVQW